MATFSIDETIDIAIKRHRAGEYDESEALFRRVLSQFGPDILRAQLYLGVLLADTGKYYEALYRFDRVLKLDRKNPTAHSNRGTILGQLGHHDEALVELNNAAHLMPDNPAIWNNIGNTLIFLDRHKESIEPLMKCLDLDPYHQVSHYNIGIAFLRIGETVRGMKHLEYALKLDPGHHEARFNLGLGQLFLGDFENGLKNYESRWATASYAEYKTKFPQQKWIGDPADLTGKNVMVYGDQGIGDFLMFSRYMPHVMRTGANVYIAPHTELHDIVQATFPGAKMLRHGDPMPEVDCRIPLPSCPLAFGTTAQTIPPPIPFVVPPDVSMKWSVVMGGHVPQLKVGVCWSGNFRHINDKQRSIPLKTFKTLLNPIDASVAFYSLQYDIRPEDQDEVGNANELRHLGIKDYVDTFGIIANLDLVITVDTSVAHAAALMGVPTWIMLPTPRIDWRWGQSGTTTYWYPSATLYRQPREGAWDSVIQTMRRDLRVMAKQAA